MVWTKNDERAYVDGDKHLVKHTRTFRLDLGDPQLTLRYELQWELDRTTPESNGEQRLKLNPGALTSAQHISGTATFNGCIKIIGSAEETWSTIDVVLYRATLGLKSVDLNKPDIEVQPQVLWHDAEGDEPKRPAALMLVLTLPPEVFDVIERHIDRRSGGTVSILVAIDIFESKEPYSWVSANNYRVYYITSGSSNGAVFEQLLASPPSTTSSGMRKRLTEAAEEEIAAIIRRFCEEWKVQEDHNSQTGSILRALCHAAADHDAAAGTSVEDFRDLTLHVVAGLVDGLREAVTPSSEYEANGKLDFWIPPRQPFAAIKRNKAIRRIDRNKVEEVADRYLRLPYRCAEFDRLLADMPAAMEIYAYGETVLVKNPIARVVGMSASPFYPRPIRNWLIGQVWNFVVFGTPIAAAWWLVSKQWIESDTALWVTLGSGGIFLLLLGISILALPLLIYRSAREKASAINQLQAMQAVYTAIQSRGLTSARHVIRLVEASAAHDVIWPGELHLLLDDIVGRGGRF